MYYYYIRRLIVAIVYQSRNPLGMVTIQRKNVATSIKINPVTGNRSSLSIWPFHNNTIVSAPSFLINNRSRSGLSAGPELRIDYQRLWLSSRMEEIEVYILALNVLANLGENRMLKRVIDGFALYIKLDNGMSFQTKHVRGAAAVRFRHVREFVVGTIY